MAQGAAGDRFSGGKRQRSPVRAAPFRRSARLSGGMNLRELRAVDGLHSLVHRACGADRIGECVTDGHVRILGRAARGHLTTDDLILGLGAFRRGKRIAII